MYMHKMKKNVKTTFKTVGSIFYLSSGQLILGIAKHEYYVL